MNVIIRKEVKAAVCCITLIMAMYSCQKDEYPLAEAVEPLHQARQLFENRNKTASVDMTCTAYRLAKDGKLQWYEATVRERGDTVIVFVPVETRDYLAGDETQGTLHQITTQLRAFKIGHTDWRFDLVTYVPEGEGWTPGGGFIGTALVQDWFGGPLRYTRFYDGQPLRNGHQPHDHIHKLMGWTTVCYSTTIYGYVNGILNTTSTTTTCISVPSSDPGEWQVPAPPEEGGGGSSGGSCGASNNTFIVDINNDVKDPFLKTMVQA